jgi:hypothetical protein
MSGRLEFRIFGPELAKQRNILSTQFRSRGKETRSDLYFLGRHHSLSYKLRDSAALDLKELVGHEGKYEHWRPCGYCDLPDTGKAIVAAFPGNAALPDLRHGFEYHAPELTAEFVRNGFRAVLVQKSRERFSSERCLVEITRLTTDISADYWTIAIEGSNAADLDRLGSKLGLTGWENQSFPAWITAQVSTTPHPEKNSPI